MLLIDVEHPLLVGKKVCLKTAGFLSGPKILVDGVEPPKGANNIYIVTNYNGNQVNIRVRNTILDPVPLLEINGERFSALPQLSPVEYIWVLTPMAMIFVGGGIGGLLGGAAAYANIFVFRSKMTKPGKYLVTGGITAVAMLLYFSFCMTLAVAIRGGLPEGPTGPKSQLTTLSKPSKFEERKNERSQEINEIADKVANAVVENGLYESATLRVIRKELLDDWLTNNRFEFRNALQAKFDLMGGKYKVSSDGNFDLCISDDADPVAVFINDRKLEVKPKD